MTAQGFAALLEGFFTDRLLRQLRASPFTVASYRDTFRLLLRFAEKRLDRAPSQLEIEDLDAPFLTDFLDHLEQERGNGARTRNVRLAALHGFFRYVALTEPAHALRCQRILAIPSKRFERRTVEFLDEREAQALLDAPDTTTSLGRRDRTLLLVALQTGLRLGEIVALCCVDVALGTGAHVRCQGKGRKMRCTPLRTDVAKALRAWLREIAPAPDAPVFPSSKGGRLSHDAVQRLVARHVAVARGQCPSLREKAVTPHTLRHSAAMALLRAGVDRSVIALWLGHESVETTQIYLHADMGLKERALARTASTQGASGRFRPDDALLAFLEAL
jgi:site-specific recombinase XerD